MKIKCLNIKINKFFKKLIKIAKIKIYTIKIKILFKIKIYN